MSWTPFNFFKYDPEQQDFDKTTFNIKQALNNNWDHIVTLITEIRDRALESIDTPTENSKKVLTSGGAYTALEGKGNKASTTETTLLAASWNTTAKTYSFEAEYPSATYDIEISPTDACTEEQLEAWMAAMVPSSADNTIKAFGDVPIVDIPILIKVVKK